VTVARRHGTVVSYDLNYRDSRWRFRGGQSAAQAVNQRLASLVDVMLGNEEDFASALGMSIEGVDPDYSNLPVPAFKAMIEQAAATYPNLHVVATTLRRVVSASVNDWGAVAWSWACGFAEARHRPGLEILDRVGGGDSFASGLIYALMSGMDLAAATEWGAAHGALAMTTPGDVSQADLAQVAHLAAGGGARVVR